MSKGSSSVTLKWNDIPCSSQNGPLLGYVISYTPDGGTTSTASLPIGNNQITGLTPCTNYTLMIAAENDAGIGGFSSPLSVLTDGIGKA